jgi:hypothetical protein
MEEAQSNQQMPEIIFRKAFSMDTLIGIIQIETHKEISNTVHAKVMIP